MVIVKVIKYFVLLTLFGCSSESPRVKAKKYISYVDQFFVSFDEGQEQKLDEIIDHYFDSKKDDRLLNKKIYEHLEIALKENKDLDRNFIQKLIDQKLELNKKIIPKQLSLITSFFNSLDSGQKKDALSALKKLKGKSARMRFWLGEEE